ncbi:hypothetical protein ACFWY5_29800 [Nonomuraea sp. NPDC059007]|uniref:hypothetical protein n=1 Tax=Nonomuraea sp. NPDC059007 TaxID=3346692 RepID=UPI0036D0A7F1
METIEIERHAPYADGSVEYTWAAGQYSFELMWDRGPEVVRLEVFEAGRWWAKTTHNLPWPLEDQEHADRTVTRFVESGQFWKYVTR